MKIDKDIPLPERRNGGKYPFSSMEVGDSFLYTDPPSKSSTQVQAASAKVNRWLTYYKSEFKFTCRKVEGGVRVWRIK